MDNLSAHKDKRVQQIAQRLGVKIIFQPPYSPEFTPIELGIQSKHRFVRKDHELLKDYCNIFKIQSKIFLPNTLTNGVNHAAFGFNIYVLRSIS